MSPIQVITIDDQEVVLHGLDVMLLPAEDIQIVGSARNGAAALDLARDLTPDVVLMDVKMPVMDGITATRQLKTRFPQLPVILITSYEDEYLVTGIEVGADGYLAKDLSGPELATAIRQVVAGEPYISPRLQRPLLNSLARLARHDEPAELSTRQVRVLSLLAAGHSNIEISSTLGLSLSTVKRDVHSICVALNVPDRAAATAEAAKRKII
jgi:two-component system, NarL family, response regulator LiaR